MDETARRSKKIAEARRLKDLPPEKTLEMGFSLIRFSQELREAADRARA